MTTETLKQLETDLTDLSLWYRPESSDGPVFHQVYVEREYDIGLCNPKLIVDAGANVGYASHFFATEYPLAKIAAIEPDRDNFDLLWRNLESFGDRVSKLHAAVWTHYARLKVIRGQYRGGLPWAYQVRPADPTETPDVFGMTIDLLLRGNYKKIDLLKMDIEGAEAPIFNANPSWIDRVDNIAIELHDDSHFGNATAAFHKAIDGQGFTIETRGQLTIARRD